MAGTDFGDDATRRTMERDLRARLEEDRPLRVYCGFDPTKVDLTLGHAVPMRKLRQFQEFGHEVTFLIGNFTALIGDPTGRDTTRPVLTREQVAENAKTYTDQAFVILDRSKTVVAYNADWLDGLGFGDVLRLTGQYTVAQFLRRENFGKRYDEGTPIHVSELLYAMLQAYDAFHLNTDVQIGGSDQLFNLMAGRQLQEAWGQRPQVCITLPILVGTDGHEKMSKSLGNYIGLTESPNEMFGKVMSIPDSATLNYYTLATPLRPAEVEAIGREIEAGTLRPMDAKKRLAEEITAVFHGRPAAEAAREYFEATIQRREQPAEMPEYAIGGDTPLMAVLVAAGLAGSNGEVRRLVTQGAVSVNGVAATEAAVLVSPGDEVRVGRHRFLRLVRA
ncbi:MAG: tyrosine--tRNA ligase [Dehalococcoidia bacterium]|nr:MAG: tyrosine--tRNA ligase [Dehalococcoidia bacterium]